MHYLHGPLHCGTTQESHRLSMERLRTGEYFLLKQRNTIGLYIYCTQGNLVSSALLPYPSFWVDWEIRQENKADKHQNSSLIIDELNILYFWFWTSIFYKCIHPEILAWEFLLWEEWNRGCASLGQPVPKRKGRIYRTVHPSLSFLLSEWGQSVTKHGPYLVWLSA